MKKYRRQVDQERTKLIHEAIRVTKELEDIAIIGAVAVFLHTWSGRESQDLDLVVASNLSDQKLNEKGYKSYPEGGKGAWLSPRGRKIDIKRDRPVNEIPISTIIDTGVSLTVKNAIIKVASLEMLVLMKSRTRREQDMEDLSEIAKQKYDDISWEKLKSISKSEMEYNEIRSTMRLFRDTKS